MFAENIIALSHLTAEAYSVEVIVAARALAPKPKKRKRGKKRTDDDNWVSERLPNLTHEKSSDHLHSPIGI